MHNATEKRRIINVNIAKGHLAAAVHIMGGRVFIEGMRCVYCGKVFKCRFANAADHLRKHHRKEWYVPVEV